MLFGSGIYYARRSIKESEFPPDNPKSPVRFARRALMISTLISISGFTLLTTMVSALFDVNSSRELGKKMKTYFGDRYKIVKKPNSTDISNNNEKILKNNSLDI